MRRELTDRQRQFYDFVRDFHAEHGVFPTVREMCRRFDVQVNAAAQHLDALVKKGWLERKGKARWLRLTDDAPEVVLKAGELYVRTPPRPLGRAEAAALAQDLLGALALLGEAP